MGTNILKAIYNISNMEDFSLSESYSGQNRINNVGEALEFFVKDLFCSSFSTIGVQAKINVYTNFLSYLGNQNNPPDFVINQGDAVEVKKISSLTGGLALNSSYPKSKLHIDDSKINVECRNCDEGNWREKDMLYSVGTVRDGDLKVLWFVYGDCYAASRHIYQSMLDRIKSSIVSSHIQLSDSNEITRVNRVDPLGITNLRVRGMWGISSPHNVFGDFTNYATAMNFASYTIMTVTKYHSFPEEDRDRLETNDKISVTDIEIPSPDNPANMIDAKLISFIQS